jgi:drug/metabolite transporter (DMT)-like permease
VKRVLLVVLLVGVTAIWGWTFVVVRDATAAYGVVGFLAIRFAIAAAALGPICLKRVTWRTLRAGAAIGVAMAAGYLLQTFGLQYTTPTNSGLITGLFVVFAPISAKAFFRVRMDWTLLVSVVISLIGLVLLTGQMPGERRRVRTPHRALVPLRPRSRRSGLGARPDAGGGRALWRGLAVR